MKKSFLLIGIILLYCLTRFLALTSAGSFWFDEAFSVHFSLMPLRQMLQYLQFEHNPQVHFILLHGWMQLFGASETAARALSVVAGFFSLIMIYLLGTKLFNRRVGLWAAFFMTISTMMLYHQTEARMYGLLGLWGLLFIYCFWMQAKQPGTNYSWLALYTLFGTLLVNTHMTAWALVAAVWIYWGVQTFHHENREGKSGIWAWIFSNAVITGSFLLWLIPVAINKKSVGNVSQGWFFSQNEGGYFFSHLSNYLLNGEQAMIIRSAGALIVFLLIVLAVTHWHKPDWWQRIKSLFEQTRWPFEVSLEWSPEIRFLLFLLLIPLLIGFGLQITVTKYLLTTGLVVFLLMARGMERIRSYRLQLIAAMILVLLVLPLQLKLMFAPRHNWDKAGDKLEELSLADPEAFIISHSFAWAMPLDFYYEGDKDITPFYPLDDNLTLDERIVRYNWQAIVNHDNVNKLAEIAGDAQSLILVSSTPDETDEDPVKAWLWGRGYRLEESFSWEGYGDPEILVFSNYK